jgi:hypothetical protein
MKFNADHSVLEIGIAIAYFNCTLTALLPGMTHYTALCSHPYNMANHLHMHTVNNYLYNIPEIAAAEMLEATQTILAHVHLSCCHSPQKTPVHIQLNRQ